MGGLQRLELRCARRVAGPEAIVHGRIGKTRLSQHSRGFWIAIARVPLELPRPPLESTPRSARSWWVRWRWTLLVLGVIAVGVFFGLRWADEGWQRKFVLFEAPLRLVENERVTGTFESESDGSFLLVIRFRRDATQDLGGPSERLRAEFEISYAIRDADGHETHGVSGDGGGGWGWSGGGEEVGLFIGRMENARRGRYGIEAHVDRASPRLASYRSSLLVQRDWIDLRYKVVASRTLQVVAGAAAALIVWVLAVVFFAWRRRRAMEDTSAAHAPSE
jgi:hypothetical protein